MGCVFRVCFLGYSRHSVFPHWPISCLQKKLCIFDGRDIFVVVSNSWFTSCLSRRHCDKVNIVWKFLFLLFEVGVTSVFASESDDIPEQLEEGLKLVAVWELAFTFVSVYLAEISLMNHYNHGMSSLFQVAFLSVIYENVTKNGVKLFGFSFASYLSRLVFRTVQDSSFWAWHE